jgi:hypothetical protein
MQLPDIFLDFLRKARKDQLVHALEYVFEEFNNQMSSVDDQLHDKQKIISIREDENWKLKQKLETCYSYQANQKRQIDKLKKQIDEAYEAKPENQILN